MTIDGDGENEAVANFESHSRFHKPSVVATLLKQQILLQWNDVHCHGSHCSIYICEAMLGMLGALIYSIIETSKVLLESHEQWRVAPSCWVLIVALWPRESLDTN